MSASVALLFCNRHGKFIKSHNSGFKRPIKMIETRKYSTLKGPIRNRDYNDAPSISRYFIANEFDIFFTRVQAGA